MFTPNAIRCSESARYLARHLKAIADQLEIRADQLDFSRSNAHAYLDSYRTRVRAANAVAAYIESCGLTEARAIERAAIDYNLPRSDVHAHWQTIKKRREIAALASMEKAAREMSRRGLPQRTIAERLGVSQPRVSQIMSCARHRPGAQ